MNLRWFVCGHRHSINTDHHIITQFSQIIQIFFPRIAAGAAIPDVRSLSYLYAQFCPWYDVRWIMPTFIKCIFFVSFFDSYDLYFTIQITTDNTVCVYKRLSSQSCLWWWMWRDSQAHSFLSIALFLARLHRHTHTDTNMVTSDTSVNSDLVQT